MKKLLSYILSLSLILGAPAVPVLADPKPPTLLDTLNMVTKEQQNFDAYLAFTAKQVEAFQKGQKPPYQDGVPITDQLFNHYKVLFTPKVQGEFFKLFSSAVGGDGGSCVGTPVFKTNFCHRCTRRLPFIGCVNEKIITSINYRFPTQWTERTSKAYQSAVTSRELTQLSKVFRYSDAAQYAQLFDIKNFNPKEIVKALPHDLLSTIELKHQWIQAQLGFAGIGLMAGKPNPQDLMNSLMDGLRSVGVDRKVLGAVKELPIEHRGALTTDAKLGLQQYAFTDVPAYIPRMLDNLVIRKLPPMRVLPWFSVGLGSLGFGDIVMPDIKIPDIKVPDLKIPGLPANMIKVPKIQVPNIGATVPSLGFGGGVQLGPVTAHNIKFPAAPGIDLQGLAGLADIAAGKGSVSTALGGVGQPIGSDGTFSQVFGKNGFGGIFGQQFNNPFGNLGGKSGGLGDLGAFLNFGGFMKILPRSANFNPILDNYSSLISIPKIGMLAGSLPSSIFSFYPLLDGRLADSVPSMMKILKSPFLCDKLTGESAGLLKNLNIMESNPHVKTVLSAMMLINPVLGKEFMGAFNQAFGGSLGFKPPCMNFGLGEAGRPTTQTTSNLAVATLAKAAGFDGSFISRATTVLNPVTGRVGSPTYYRKIFQFAGIPMPPKTDKFLDLVNYGHTSRFEENPRPKAATLPQNCSNPEVPEAAFGSLRESAAPLDGPDQTSQWTAFRICPEGDPLNDDSAKGLILGFVWPIMKAVGAQNLWSERRE